MIHDQLWSAIVLRVVFFLLVGFQLLGAISQLIYENCLFIQEIGWHLNIRKVTLLFLENWVCFLFQ